MLLQIHVDPSEAVQGMELGAEGERNGGGGREEGREGRRERVRKGGREGGRER